MTLFQDTGGDPRACVAQLADVLALYGAIGDAACGNPPGLAQRKAATAVSLARMAQCSSEECDAIYIAGLLHAIGAIGNPAYRKGEPISERFARMESWDVPSQGARICEEIAALPRETADIVRWQAECWDGTGFPDQLRWHGIPQSAVLLSLAEAFVRAPEPEDSLASVFAQSGRAFGPDMARLFTMWFHTTGGEPQPVSFPLEALGPVSSEDARDLLDTIADRVDDHNGVAGRWRRIARLTDAASELLRLSEDDAQALKIAVRFYGCGELGELVSSEPSFDPLARLGIDDRAAHGIAAADLLASNATLRSAASILRARGEWFDGTGKPDGLKHRAIPAGAPILAGAIAYDSLDHKDRIDTAAGTQFDPRAVRAILEAARTRA